MIALLVTSLLMVQAPRDSLTIGAALAWAKAHRGQANASAAMVNAARAGVRVAGTIPNPIASYSHTDDPPRQHATLDQSFSWLLTRGADRAAAQAGVRRAAADSTQLGADFAAEVRSAFYGVLAATELERVAVAQGIVADSLATLAARRVEIGDIAEFERDQLTLEASRAGQRRSRAREVAEVAWARLVRTLGWDQRVERPVLLGGLDDELSTANSERLLAEGQDATPPLLAAAIADSVHGTERAHRAALSRVPLPSVVAGADWDDPENRRGALAVLGFSLPLPLWQRGNGELALAQAEAAQLAAATGETRLEIKRQLTVGAVRVAEAAGRAQTARDSLIPIARRLRERATVAYRAGETGVIPLLEALRAEREVSAEAVDDLLAFQEALAAWKQTLGEAE